MDCGEQNGGMAFAEPLQRLNIMKKTNVLFTILLGLSYTLSFSQQVASVEELSSKDAKRRIVPGFKAGINRSNVYDEQGQDFIANGKTGFAGGFFIALPIGSFLGFQPEVLISQKGFSSTGTIYGDRYWLERTSTFLEFPLQVQLKPFRFLSLLGGVQYSYLLSQRDAFTNGVNTVAQSEEFANDNIRKNVFGGNIGFDVNIRHVVLSGRYGWDLRANRGDGSSFTPRYKNVWLQATVGYRFY